MLCRTAEQLTMFKDVKPSIQFLRNMLCRTAEQLTMQVSVDMGTACKWTHTENIGGVSVVMVAKWRRPPNLLWLQLSIWGSKFEHVNGKGI